MSENSFANALHNFTMNAAAGDAIRHLTDKGYTLPQIKDMLSFPAKTEYIAKVMWEQLVDTCKVIETAIPTQAPFRLPDLRSGQEIIEHRDAYGRKSFVRVKKESPEEMIFSPEDYVQYENVWVLTSALEQVSSLSDHIPLKDRSTGSHRDT